MVKLREHVLEAPDELVLAGLADVVGIDVGELGKIKPGGRLVDVIDVKPGDGLLGREYLGIAVAPAEPNQVVAQTRRQKAHGSVGLDAECTVALRQLGAVGSMDQGN